MYKLNKRCTTDKRRMRLEGHKYFFDVMTPVLLLRLIQPPPPFPSPSGLPQSVGSRKRSQYSRRNVPVSGHSDRERVSRGVPATVPADGAESGVHAELAVRRDTGEHAERGMGLEHLYVPRTYESIQNIVQL